MEDFYHVLSLYRVTLTAVCLVAMSASFLCTCLIGLIGIVFLF